MAEKQIKHFLFGVFQKPSGCLLPDELRFCLRDSRHISVTKEISCYEAKVNLLPDTFKYNHLGARKSYQQEITIFHSIAALIGEIEKFISWPSIKTDMKFDAFKLRLINMIFGVSEGVSLEAFKAFKRLFDCYQRNVDYLYELIGIKFHHAKHFFSKFLHKEVEYQIDHLLDLGGISQRKNKNLDI